MKDKWTIFAVLAFLVLVMNSVSGAVSTSEIDSVRNKGVLENEDFQIIDNFVAEGVQELVKTRDFTSIARIRTVILARKSSSRDSAAAQYSEQFSKSAYKYISSGLKEASGLTPKERKFKMVLNLLILVDGLSDLRLADLAMEKLNDDNTVIRYWAIHSVTNPGITKQLNSAKATNLNLARNIVERLKGLVKRGNPETIALMAEFAAEVDIPQGEDLLLQITDMRINKYANWTVDYELLDASVLRLLCNKISSGGSNKPAIARRFGQLYSYAIQRYVKVKERDFLAAAQIGQLASVLVETEDKCIRELLGQRQMVIKRAVERDDVTGLLLEHNRLLGDETRSGELAVKLNFDYGPNPNGNKRTAPLTLPEPPEELIIDN
jgi:hypothetical protein